MVKDGGKQHILHRAEEVGQSRPLTVGEVGAYALMSVVKGLAVGGIGAGIFSVLRVLAGVWHWTDTAFSFVALGFTSVGWQVLGDLDDLTEGLRSYRSVETFTPPVEVPEPELLPDIVVHPYQGDPYVIGRGRPALPEQRGPQLTPQVVGGLIQTSLEEHDGYWSRRRLTGIVVGGITIRRTLWEKVTKILASQGFLVEQGDGSHRLPPDVETYEDVRRYIPALPQLGGQDDSPPVPSPPTHPPTRPPETLAERHQRERFRELDWSVRVYLSKEVGEDGA